MTEREQVIAELLYLKHDCLEGSATDQTLDKAIALLKAQEPRVLSVADIIDEHITPDIIWVERRHENDICPGLWQIDHYEMGLGGVLDDLGEEIAKRPDAYNTLWRCWTSRPDQATREATPWN